LHGEPEQRSLDVVLGRVRRRRRPEQRQDVAGRSRSSRSRPEPVPRKPPLLALRGHLLGDDGADCVTVAAASSPAVALP
jgi:hypothetical protein